MLVLGAAGGVGLAAVQIGKVVGAIVIAVARYFNLFHPLIVFVLWELGLLFAFNLMHLQMEFVLFGC